MPHKHNVKTCPPKLYKLQQHKISRNMLPKEAIRAVETLSERGFLAYIVGGSIRDLYLGYKPKDFDIATSARPEQVKQIFRGQSWIVGRRFRLAQVRINNVIIDVSTFRSKKSESDCLTIRDNRWGSAPEDALKRDLTINGLFYDPMSESITDYVGGVDDLNERILRVIGDPKTRFRQDPVRMIRLVKFKAKLDFEIDPIAMKALIESRKEIAKSSQARISDEILKTINSGFSYKFFKLMYQNELLENVMPELHKLLQKDKKKLSLKNLKKIDSLIENNGFSSDFFSKEMIIASMVSPFIEHNLEESLITKKVDKILNGPFNIRGKIKSQIISILESRNAILNKQGRCSVKKRKQKRDFEIDAENLIRVEAS